VFCLHNANTFNLIINKITKYKRYLSGLGNLSGIKLGEEKTSVLTQ
jgi:hypothetical protein